jgi:hypothetical protein
MIRIVLNCSFRAILKITTLPNSIGCWRTVEVGLSNNKAPDGECLGLNIKMPPINADR